jgi:response regulator NasT
LVADGNQDELERSASLVTALGHEAKPCALGAEALATAASSPRPDVALVGLEAEPQQGLDLIGELAGQALCPSVARLDVRRVERVAEAARRGVFAYVIGSDLDGLRNALEIALRRFREARALQEAFARRATIEQAKGILMARHSVDGDRAFDLIRDQSQRTGRKVVDIAESIVQSHVLLLQPIDLETDS